MEGVWVKGSRDVDEMFEMTEGASGSECDKRRSWGVSNGNGRFLRN